MRSFSSASFILAIRSGDTDQGSAVEAAITTCFATVTRERREAAFFAPFSAGVDLPFRGTAPFFFASTLESRFACGVDCGLRCRAPFFAGTLELRFAREVPEGFGRGLEPDPMMVAGV